MITSEVLSEISSVTGSEMPRNLKAVSSMMKRVIKSAGKDGINGLSDPATSYLKECIRAHKVNATIPVPVDFQEEISNKTAKKREKREEDSDFRLEQFECQSTTKLISVRGLLEMKESGLLRLPSFQRKYVWSPQLQKYFLEGVLRGIPVFSIMLSVDEETNERFLLDGQQRTETLARFYNGEIEVDGCRYSGLVDRQRNKFLMQDIVIHEIRADRTYWPDIFHHINKGGTPLSDIEIWRAVFDNPLMDRLEDLAENHTVWADIYGSAKDKRYKGLYLLLRSVAMNMTYQEYQKPMKRFLIQFLNQLTRNPNIVDANQIYSDIDRILFGIRNLGRTIFRTTIAGQVNIGMVDCVLHAGFEALRLRPDCTAREMNDWLSETSKQLLSDPAILNSLTLDTSGNDNVFLRMKKSEEIIRQITGVEL